MGADAGRFLCLTVPYGGTSYLCPLFCLRSRSHTESREENIRGVGKLKTTKLILKEEWVKLRVKFNR